MSKVQHSMAIKISLLIALVIMLLILFALGFWQLARAEQKRQLIEQWQNAPELTSLPDLAVMDGSKISLQGFFDTQAYFLLDNRTRNGQPGYELIALFTPVASEQLLLVNLGWLSAPVKREQLPRVNIPAGLSEVRGHLINPAPSFQLAEDAWPDADIVRIQQLDMSKVATRYSNLYPALLRLESQLLEDVYPGWPVVNMPPVRHIGYAVQWFGLAAVLVIGSALLWRKTRREIAV